jgi:hypothetical protein
MPSVSPGSPGTPNSEGSEESPARLPLRWAVIVLVTATAGIACFAAGGIYPAVVAAAAVAAALHKILALGLPTPGTPPGHPGVGSPPGVKRERG